MCISYGDIRAQKSNNTRKEHVTALPDSARIGKRETGNWQLRNGGNHKSYLQLPLLVVSHFILPLMLILCEALYY